MQEPEDDYGRMVETCPHHGPRLTNLLRPERLVRELVCSHLRMTSVAPAERLLPHENAVLVAKVEEPLGLLVVGTTKEVAAKRLQILNVRQHHRFRRRRSERRMRLVPIRTLQIKRLTIQPQLPVLRLDCSYSETRL